MLSGAEIMNLTGRVLKHISGTNSHYYALRGKGMGGGGGGGGGGGCGC